MPYLNITDVPCFAGYQVRRLALASVIQNSVPVRCVRRNHFIKRPPKQREHTAGKAVPCYMSLDDRQLTGGFYWAQFRNEAAKRSGLRTSSISSVITGRFSGTGRAIDPCESVCLYVCVSER